ncbi:putative membrane protein YhdT [Scopulibacillus daqui]|uniref:Membrane protein YhdT n=1 Tax=Scopulibacillus daqui TaxID=1469162 RepID=A0ABS2PVX1_9BACL|nr:YhdT family protein [Scopulibacillus daqui]MBM7644193.1 putative membrane protein YhdT [Scopulibacillus daqui]
MQQFNRKPFKEDPRYKIANREALFGVILALINFIWWYGFAYGLGSKPVESFHYILGFPAWFFYSCILGFVVVTVLVIILVKFIFKDIPLDNETKKVGDDE